MKQPKVKEPVRLRSKSLKDGSESLYLDIYWNGIRQYEFLKLYLIPETGKSSVSCPLKPSDSAPLC